MQLLLENVLCNQSRIETCAVPKYLAFYYHTFSLLGFPRYMYVDRRKLLFKALDSILCLHIVTQLIRIFFEAAISQLFP